MKHDHFWVHNILFTKANILCFPDTYLEKLNYILFIFKLHSLNFHVSCYKYLHKQLMSGYQFIIEIGARIWFTKVMLCI